MRRRRSLQPRPRRQSPREQRSWSSVNMSESSIIAARLQMARAGDVNTLARHLDATAHEVHIDAADVSLAVDKRSNALQAACWSGNAAAVALLLGRGANPDATRQHNGGTCLCIAAHAGHCAVVRALAAHGAQINLPNDNGASPVLIAAEHGHLETLAALLAMGADPDVPDSKGCSPCYIATSRGHLGCLRVLRAYGADLDAATKDDRAAPLHIAVGRGRLSAFELLLDAGARTDLLVVGEARKEWSIRQLIMAKFGLHAATRQAFLDPLAIVEDVAPVVAARQRLSWMGRRVGAVADLTTDLKRLVGERMLPHRARLAVCRRAIAERDAVADAAAEPDEARVERGACEDRGGAAAEPQRLARSAAASGRIIDRRNEKKRRLAADTHADPDA